MNIEKKVREILLTEMGRTAATALTLTDIAEHATQSLLSSPDLVIMEREKWEKIIGYLTEYEEWFPCLEVEEALGEGKE